MISFAGAEIQKLDKRYRVALVNSISGYKSANLIGTARVDGRHNIAIFSSVIHLGSDPSLVGFITRPISSVRHTYRNILATGYFTVNHVSESLRSRAHQTSARYPDDVSEFDACHIEAQFIDGFQVPFVKESPIKYSCTLEDDIHIPSNNTRLVVGRIKSLYVNDGLILDDGTIDLHTAEVVAISSLDGYHKVGEGVRFAYAMPDKPTPEK